jgi:hypothetical protein
MESIPKTPNAEQTRYFTYLTWRRNNKPIDKLARKYELGSATALYHVLRQDGFPVCEVCGDYSKSLGHCEPPGRKRKARRGGGEGRPLPAAEGAVELFAPVIARLQDLFSSLAVLEEAYQDERFEAVERYPHAAITGNDELSHEDDVVLPLGVTQNPSRISTDLIAAYVIAEKPIEPLVEVLHDKPGKIDRAKLDKKVAHLRLLAGHVATLVRGGIVRTGHHTEELSTREQEARRYYSNQLRAGVAEEEIQRTLLTERWGFKRADMPRIKNLGQNFLYR